VYRISADEPVPCQLIQFSIEFKHQIHINKDGIIRVVEPSKATHSATNWLKIASHVNLIIFYALRQCLERLHKYFAD
jgi:hypothetical protein